MTYCNKRLIDYRNIFVTLVLLLLAACTTHVASISPKQAADMLASKQAVIIDVREQDEWNELHIEGAIFIPLASLDSRLDELSQYKDSPIIMQCRSGRRSEIAAKSLMKAGFTQVKNLEGGILAWEKAHLPTVSGP